MTVEGESCLCVSSMGVLFVLCGHWEPTGSKVERRKRIVGRKSLCIGCSSGGKGVGRRSLGGGGRRRRIDGPQRRCTEEVL